MTNLINRQQVVDVLLNLPQDNRNPVCEYALPNGEPLCVVANALDALGLPLPPMEHNVERFGANELKRIYADKLTPRAYNLLVEVQDYADRNLWTNGYDEDPTHPTWGESIEAGMAAAV